MSTDKPRSTPTKVCPSCGTRVSESANRCLVCGHQFTAAGGKSRSAALSSGSSGVPEIRLSIPIAIGLLALFLIVGGTLTFAALAGTGRVSAPTPLPSPSVSPTATLSPTPETPTPTSTPQPTYTPLAYAVQFGDDCNGIAFAFHIQAQDIILANPSVGAACSIFQNQILVIPQPTFTPTPAATATLGEAESTIAACETEDYVVQEGDTMSLIAVTRGVPMEAILEWNHLTTDFVFLGQHITIPLCQQTFVGASTVTPTIAPPYPAPELLLPADGAPFDSSNDTISLQWSSVGTLRNNEFYQVTVVDITGGQNRHIVDEVTDTSFIIPTSFRPNDGRPHVYRWSVVTVAQIGVDADGLPVYVTGGPASESRVFVWSGTSAEATQTP